MQRIHRLERIVWIGDLKDIKFLSKKGKENQDWSSDHGDREEVISEGVTVEIKAIEFDDKLSM